jgi:hypothetical protein
MQIEIQGLEELIQRLDRVQVQNILLQPMTKAVIQLETAMKKYPNPPTKSQYKRTRVLGNSWTHEVTKNLGGVLGRVGTAIDYAPWVQSRRFQAKVHLNRWQTAEQVLEDRRSMIVADFNDAVKKALHA